MTETALTSHQLASALRTFRDNDVRVLIDGTYVPIAEVVYHRQADFVVLTLSPGMELSMLLEREAQYIESAEEHFNPAKLVRNPPRPIQTLPLPNADQPPVSESRSGSGNDGGPA